MHTLTVDPIIAGLGVWVVCAGTCGVIADGRGRNALGWFLLGLMFGLFALVAVCALPLIPKSRGADGAQSATGHYVPHSDVAPYGPTDAQAAEIARGKAVAAEWAAHLGRTPYGKSRSAG